MSFDPTKPMAGDIQVIENALIVPFGEGKVRGARRPAGIYDAAGNYLPMGQCLRNSSAPITVQPDRMPENVENVIAGTWLFGGILYSHFGHFLAETTSRMWALDHLPVPVDGMIFVPRKQVSWPLRFMRPIMHFLEMFGPAAAASTAIVAPTRVERLVLGPQGFGTGDMMGGSPEYRAFIRKNFGADIAADGAENIYISRKQLFSKRGRYFGEAHIESLFEAEDYRIFHPQDHSVAEQIAQYKAAKRIVSSDSSALHLAAFFSDPTDQIAIVMRRPGDLVEDFILQFQHFAGLRPTVIDALNGRLFHIGGARKQMSEVFSELDFPTLGQQLHQTGFITQPADWHNPDPAILEAERAYLSERLEQELVLLDPVDAPNQAPPQD